MLATRSRMRPGPLPSVPPTDLRSLADCVTRRSAELASALADSPTILVEEAGTAFLVTRCDGADVPLHLHAHPGEVEFGVFEEPAFPLLSIVATLRTSGGPRYAGVTVDIGSPDMVNRTTLAISQSSVDLVTLDPELHFVAAHRLELPLWTRAQAHRALDQARRHLESIPPERRSFRRAWDEFQQYVTPYLTA